MTILAFWCAGQAASAEADYVGITYDARTFPLCQKYGCRELGEQKFTDPAESFLYLQLLRLDAKVTLSLSQKRTVMGLFTLLPGDRLSAQGLAYLQNVMVKSADEDFEPYLLPQCFARLKAEPGNFYKRGIILADNHYGVQCIRKREKQVHYWGVWVYFDR